MKLLTATQADILSGFMHFFVENNDWEIISSIDKIEKCVFS